MFKFPKRLVLFRTLLLPKGRTETPYSIRRSTLVRSMYTVRGKKVEGKVVFVGIFNILKGSFLLNLIKL